MPPRAASHPSREGRRFLPEVQALRAVAVSLVVLYHLWPNRLPGGFVGVDVFFVISGFLITSHLHREVDRSGRIALATFYARRARRLLPAALLVMLAGAVATVVFLPAPRWSAAAGELLASALYGQNWLLAGRAVDYSAAQNAASPFQHFWSLSVEEQFYLLWPPLILLLLLLARRLAPARRDGLLLGGILTVCAASLAWSIHATATDQAAAYFTTPTRIWELGAGAALALARQRTRTRPAAAPSAALRVALGVGLPIALRWLGFAAIAVAALTLSAATPFPGSAALLPVLGTVAVIAAGDTGRRDPLTHLLSRSPVQVLGNISYSLYLWHWPGIVILPFVVHHTPTATDKLLLLAMSVGLAWLSKELIEDPTQRWRPLGRPRLTALATVASIAAVAAGSGLIWHQVQRNEQAALVRLAAASSDPCFGAASMGSQGSGCPDPFRSPQSLTLPAEDAWWTVAPGCVAKDMPAPMEPTITCSFSNQPPTRTVALVGDSHALHYQGALVSIAKELNWRIVIITKGHCPATRAPIVSFEGTAQTADWVNSCLQWSHVVDDELTTLAPDYVFASGFAAEEQFGNDPARSTETGAQGFADVWTRWAASGMHVFVLRDVPSTGGVSIPDCLATHASDPLACSRPRSAAVVPDALTVAAGRVTSDRITLVDLTDRFCDRNRCYAAIGGAVVYFDKEHMTTQFSRTLAPFLLKAIGGGDR